MNSQRSMMVVVVLLGVLTFLVLSAAIWRAVGELAGTGVTPPAPMQVRQQPSDQNLAGSPPPPTHLFPARVGQIFETADRPEFANLPATRISVDIATLPAAEALANFSLATSERTDFRPPGRMYEVAPFSIRLKTAPLLEGVLQLACRTGTTPTRFTPEFLSLQYNQGEPTIGPWCVAGPFAMVLERMEAMADLSVPDAPRTNTVIHALFLAEPRIHVAQYPRTLTIEEFVDDKGTPLLKSPATLAGNGARPIANVPMSRSTFRFPMTPDHGRKVARFRGSALFMEMKASEKIDVEMSSLPLARTVAGMKLSIDAEKTNPPRLSVRLARGDMDADAWSRVVALLPELQPQLADGSQSVPLSTTVTATASGDERTIVCTLLGTPREGGGGKFSMELPTDVRQIRMPFDFKDLLLP